jgi:virginiamycin B lyase
VLRRHLLALPAAAVLVLLPAAAGAARPRASLSAPPQPLVAGVAWNATLSVRPAPASRPAVVARLAGGRALTFATRKLAPGRFRVRFVFLEPGRWSLTARIGRARVALRTVAVAPQPPLTSPLPGAAAFRVCGGEGAPYAQYALALGFGSAWVACGRRSEVWRVDLADGRVQARIALPGVAVWSLAAGEGGVWALALRDSVVHRIDPATNRAVARIDVGTAAPYLWAGGAAVWVADDSGRALVRVDPATNRVAGRVPVGDGPAGFAFDGRFVWVLNHRENSLDRIDPATNEVRRMAGPLDPSGNAAAERIAILGGVLWVTGRGLDLLRVSPDTGAVLGRTEIGAAGIDVRTDGEAVWVAAYSDAAEPRGDPEVGAVLRVAPGGEVVERRQPTRSLFANGFAAADGKVWILDSVHGLLLRLPA